MFLYTEIHVIIAQQAMEPRRPRKAAAGTLHGLRPDFACLSSYLVGWSNPVEPRATKQTGMTGAGVVA